MNNIQLDQHMMKKKISTFNQRR